MKKMILTSLSAIFLFAGHGDSNDPGMKLLMKGDKKGALEVFKKECDVDKNGWACGNVGLMLYMGLAGNKDITTSKIYYNKGCELNDVGSCENLAEIFYVENDLMTAKKYFNKVCHMEKYAKNKDEKKGVKKSCEIAKTIK